MNSPGPVPFPADAGSATHPVSALQAPSLHHLFGTDQVGRDVFSRVLYGARVSPLIALFVLVIACVVGRNVLGFLDRALPRARRRPLAESVVGGKI